MAGPRIGSLHSHGVWDRSLTPALRVAPGTEVVLELRDASGGQITPEDGPDAVERFDLGRVNPCTGPVAVDGLAPGEGLSVTILDISPAPWAWTANIPGFGLLAEDFPSAHLWISKVGGGRVRTPIGVERHQLRRDRRKPPARHGGIEARGIGSDCADIVHRLSPPQAWFRPSRRR